MHRCKFSQHGYISIVYDIRIYSVFSCSFSEDAYILSCPRHMLSCLKITVFYKVGKLGYYVFLYRTYPFLVCLKV